MSENADKINTVNMLDLSSNSNSNSNINSDNNSNNTDNNSYNTDTGFIFPIPSMSTILFILLLLSIAIIVFYYFWFAKEPYRTGEEIPDDLIEPDDTIISVFEKAKEKYGSHYALSYKNKKDKIQNITYTEYWINVETFSQRLLYFIGPNPRVAILSFNRPEWFYVHLGTMLSKGVSVGIYPTTNTENCSYIVDHSCVDLIVVENEKQLQKLVDIKMTTIKLILILDETAFDVVNTSNIINSIKQKNTNLDVMSYNTFTKKSIFNKLTKSIDAGIASILDAEIEVSKPQPEDIATIIYTSGTTGEPKGVVQTHKSIISAINSSIYSIKTRSNIDINIGERYLSYLPLNHIAAQMMDIYLPICSIGHVTFADSDALKGSLQKTLMEVKPTIFVGVPRVWEKIEEGIRSELSKQGIAETLKRMISSGKLIRTNIGLDEAKFCITAAAPLSESTRNFFRDIGIELCDVYGMSETCGPISIGVPGSSKGVGVPVMDLKIDPVTNEILVRGRSLFKNYYKDKDATEKAFITLKTKSKSKSKSKWFKTGDIGYVDRSGYLHVTGRIKDIIVTAGGENISPIPIEELILSELKQRNISEYIDHVVVVGDGRKFISALIFIRKNNKNNNKNNNIRIKIDKCMPEIIEIINKKAPNPSSTVKKYSIISDELVAGETLTHTLKIRRSVIDNIFKSQIDEMYNSE